MQGRLFEIYKEGQDTNIGFEFMTLTEIHEDCDRFYIASSSIEDALKELMQALPAGCFKISGMTLVLEKRPIEYLETFLDEVKLAFNLLTPKDLGSISYYKAIKKARTNDLDYRIYSPYFNCSVPLIEWLMCEVLSCEEGQVFKIGTIVNFHF